MIRDWFWIVVLAALALFLAALGLGMLWAGFHATPVILLPAGVLSLVGSAWLGRAVARDLPYRGKVERVTFDGLRVTRYLVDGRTESILWSELAEVRITTTDEGPWFEDVYWLLLNADASKGCAVPGGAEGQQELLLRLQELPGFRDDEVIRAMGSTCRNQFTVWKRAG